MFFMGGVEDAVDASVAEVKGRRDQVSLGSSDDEDRVRRLEERVQELEKRFEGDAFEKDLEVREDVDELRDRVDELSELLVRVVESLDG